MKPQCSAAVQRAAAALGHSKPLSQAQLNAIDDRLRSTMRQLARTDPTWQAKTPDVRMTEAATRAMQDIQAEAARKVANAQLQIIKTAATEQRIAAAHGDTRSARTVDDIDKTGAYIGGIKSEAMGSLMALLEAVKSGIGAGPSRRLAMFLFDVENPAMTRDLAREIFDGAGGRTGNKVAQEGAKAWLKTIEGMRQRKNAAGGDVGKLDYGYVPQPHDAARVRQAGRDRWVDAILPALDRSKFVDETGARLNDADMRTMLGEVWRTIAYDGLYDKQPGEVRGNGARADRGSESRQLHFKDADSYLGYLADFGRGSMYDAMVAHIGGIARDIGLIERYGPNPNAQMRLQFDQAAHADGRQVTDLPRTFGLQPQTYWDLVNGTASSPQSARLAQIGTDVRNVQTFGKLAGAVLASLTDVGTYVVTTGYNRLSYWDSIANIRRTVASREAREFLTVHGVIADSMAGEMNRWTNDNLRATWSGRLANATMRLSLMNAWTDSLRRAFSLTMMQGLARMAGTDWAALSQWDRYRMERHGITDADWAVIRQAQLTHFQGLDHLTPESIHGTGDPRAPEIVAKVLGLITDESEHAVINPDLATKGIASFGAQQRGTVLGELGRSIMQFKSFPIAMVSRHWRRMMEGSAGITDGSAPLMANRLVYFGALMLTMTALGAISLQAKQIVSGKDPIDMRGPHATKFWLKATAQGGGLSIAGDMILNDPGNSASDWIRSTTGTLAGPAVSTTVQAAAIPIETVWKRAKGKPTHAAAETVNLVRQNAPFVNLWYAKAALDHAGMHALQENLSPGYLGRMQQRTRQDWGEDYWWKPGTGLPQRAPDLAAAVGE